MSLRNLTRTLFVVTAAIGFAVPDIALAQTDAALAPIEEVIVTARKRDESLQDVPVVVSAYNSEQINRLGITNFDDLVDLTPSLTGYSASSSTQNGFFSLRGVYSGSLNFGFDQAVSTNVDGIMISSGAAGLSTQVDLQQVEILKGPQALFFGKNSTGGIIYYKTADPTDELFVQVRAAYEPNAEESIGEIVLSGPITDTLGGRVVVNFNAMDGFLDNTFPGAQDSTIQDFEEVFARVTLKWDPNDQFSGRLKVSHSSRDGGHFPIFQRSACNAILRASDTCKFDDEVWIPNPDGPAWSPFPNPNWPHTPDTDFFHEFETTMASLLMEYSINESLTLTSLTGFYEIDRDNYNVGTPTLLFDSTAPPFNFPPGVIPEPVFEAFDAYSQDAVSQEIRLASSFSHGINFLVGFFYEDGSRFQRQQFDIDPSDASFDLSNNTYSVFGEVIVDVTDTVEVTGGLRYSREEREFDVFAHGVLNFATFMIDHDVVITPNRDERNFDNVSPEFTVTWRPTEDLTTFIAYKEGFKSGSFDFGPLNISNLLLNPALDISFDDETVDGFEVGVKSEWLDNTLRLNAAYYRYEYTDLQVTTVEQSGLTVQTSIANVGGSRVQGLELEGVWQPLEIEGLTFQGALNYNHARYTDYMPSCNTSQVSLGAPGCIEFDGVPGFSDDDIQDVSGKALPFAPNWSGTIGISIDRSFAGGSLRYRGSVFGVYSGSYFADGEGQSDPLDRQDSYFLTNISFGIYDDDRGWELDFIGRNITDKFYAGQFGNDPLRPAALDRLGTVNRGRQFMLQLTLRPMEFLNN